MEHLMRTGRRRQRGLTYLAVLFFIAVSAAMLASTGVIWSHERQRDKEAELLWIGKQFREAVRLYYERTPGSVKRYPAKLEDLLEDRRYLTRHRYLRRIYRDPFTGKAAWGLVPAPTGGFMGVYSLSGNTIIAANAVRHSPESVQLPARLSDWKFMYTPDL